MALSKYGQAVKALETKVDKAIRALCGEIPPSFEEFQEMWSRMDELSKALFICHAECPELASSSDGRIKVFSQYLEKMGLVTDHYTINDILEVNNGN